MVSSCVFFAVLGYERSSLDKAYSNVATSSAGLSSSPLLEPKADYNPDLSQLEPYPEDDDGEDTDSDDGKIAVDDFFNVERTDRSLPEARQAPPPEHAGGSTTDPVFEVFNAPIIDPLTLINPDWFSFPTFDADDTKRTDGRSDLGMIAPISDMWDGDTDHAAAQFGAPHLGDSDQSRDTAGHGAALGGISLSNIENDTNTDLGASNASKVATTDMVDETTETTGMYPLGVSAVSGSSSADAQSDDTGSGR